MICILNSDSTVPFESGFYKCLLGDNASIRSSFEAANKSGDCQYYTHGSLQESELPLWASIQSGVTEFLNPHAKTRLPKLDIFVGRNNEVKSILGAIMQQRIVTGMKKKMENSMKDFSISFPSPKKISNQRREVNLDLHKILIDFPRSSNL